MLNLFRFVGLRHLTGKPLRTLLTSISVALGVGLFVAIDLINRSTLDSFRENFEAISGKAQLAVTAGETGFPEDKLNDVAKVMGVRSAVPMIEARAYLAGARTSETLQIFGIDLLTDSNVRSYKTTDQQLIEDPLVFLNQPDSIVVAKPFAEKHGLKMDSPLELATANGLKRFVVRGILTPEGPAKAYGGAIALMDIDGAALTFGKRGKVDRIDIVAKEGEDLDALAAKIRESVGPGYKVDKPEGQSQGMQQMVATFQKLMSIVSSLAVMVGVFMVANAVSISVAERRREVGTLRALGATQKGIMILFLSEAIAMGTFGALLGAWMGNTLAHSLVGSVAASMSKQYLMPIAPPNIRFGTNDLIRATLLGAVASLVAAFFPAWKATSIQPVEAIRTQKEQEGEGGEKLLKRAFGLGAALLIYVGALALAGIEPTNPIWESFNQAAAFGGVVLITPWLSVGIIALIRRALGRTGGTLLKLSQDNLLKHPRRTASNVLTLMVGLVMVVLISTMNASFRNSISAWVGRVFHADMLVSSQGRVFAFETQPIDQSIRDELMTVPEVRDALADPIGALRFVHFDYGGRTLAVKALDEPPAFLHYSTFEVKDRDTADAGRELFHSADPTIMVSRSFVNHFGNKTGDRIAIETPTGKLDARIVGVMTDYASQQGVVYMRRGLYQQYWNDPLVTVFGIYLKAGSDPEKIRQAIDARFGRDKNLMITLNSELKKEMVQTIDQSFAYLKSIEFAALLIALLGLFNTLSISVMERMRELGLLRAVGMARNQVFKMIVLESASLGISAVLIALSFGAWLAYLWVRFGVERTMGWSVEFYFPFETALRASSLGLAVALLAGLLPSRRAAYLEIKEALAYE